MLFQGEMWGAASPWVLWSCPTGFRGHRGPAAATPAPEVPSFPAQVLPAVYCSRLPTPVCFPAAGKPRRRSPSPPCPSSPLWGREGSKVPLPWRRHPRCPPPWRGAVTGCQFWHSSLGGGCNKAVGSTGHGAGGAQPLGAAEHPRDGGPCALCRWDPRLGEQNPPTPRPLWPGWASLSLGQRREGCGGVWQPLCWLSPIWRGSSTPPPVPAAFKDIPQVVCSPVLPSKRVPCPV